MTASERIILANDSTFQDRCKQAIRERATYLNGSGSFSTISTWADFIDRAQQQLVAVKNYQNSIVSDDPLTVAFAFVNASKGKEYNLTTEETTAAPLLAAWIAASSFDEFVISYFKLRGQEVQFTIGN